MIQAKILNGGKMTLPPEVQDWLHVKDGNKVSFIKDGDGVRLVNAGILALEKVQAAFAGEAEVAGLDSEEAVVALCKEVRPRICGSVQ